jgi:hypothetical protein
MRARITKVRDYFLNILFKSYITFALEAIGLFANLIAIATFFGAVNTPKESPNFYINNQEFLVWSLIALIYTTGLINARFKRRWRTRMLASGYEDEEFNWYDHPQRLLFKSRLRQEMFQRDFAFTLVIAFPLTYLYIRALDSAYTKGASSPWTTLSETATWLIPITFGIIIASSIFDNAMSLFAGD